MTSIDRAAVTRIRDRLSEALHGDTPDPLNGAEAALDALTALLDGTEPATDRWWSTDHSRWIYPNPEDRL